MLQRQAKDFLQSLTVEVASSQKTVMVYSLQWSARESLGNVALLEELDKLTSRKDQVREPSTGDEVLAVIKRRLLDTEPDAAVAKQVAREYSDVIGGMLKAQAETPSAQQDAQSQTIELRKRMEAAYPLHPALIDVMVGRWTSVDGFQRTRGALRFLASCLHALKKRGGAKPLLGPAEIPIGDVDVARAMLKDLDPQQGYPTRMKVTGASTRLRGRCDKSERLVAPVPHGHWKVLTMIGAMTIKGVRAAVTVDAATDGDLFRRFVTDALVPVLQEGDVVVMDNLQAHKAAGIKEAIEAVGARLLYLPPYSPDLSPIEPMWSKVKQHLRSIAARTVDTLGLAVTAALQAITESDCQGFFRHCGYTLQE